MPTVVDLTEEELAELRESTREADPAVAVRTAMREYLRYARRMQLKQLSGRVEMQENWAALESAEGRADVQNGGPGAG
jgi:hypothetical protein